MSNDKWTPGPWACHPFRAYVVPAEHLNRPIGSSTDSAEDLREFAQEICLLHWPDRHRPESEVKANARVMAAAPDLYKAAELACLMFERKNLSTADSDWMGDDEHEAWTALRSAMKKARGEEPTADKGKE